MTQPATFYVLVSKSLQTVNGRTRKGFLTDWSYWQQLCLCTEWDVPVSPVHPLRNEVQPDVQGQPDRAHPGGGSAEHLIGRGERGLRCSCCHEGGRCKHTISTHYRGETHARTHTHTTVYYGSCLVTLSMSLLPSSPVSVPKEVGGKNPGAEFSHACRTRSSVLCVVTALLSHYSFRQTLFFSIIFFKQLDLQKRCNHGDLHTHWQPPPSVYTPPSLNSLSCFLMVLHFFVSASVSICLRCLFWGCPMKRITKLACCRDIAIKTQCRYVASVVVNKEKRNL